MNNTHRKFTHEEREVILAKTGGVCARCGKKLDTKTMTVEHVFPQSKGGLDDEYNLLPLCYDCNINKSDYIYAPYEYYKHILPEYKERFDMYHGFVSFPYSQKSILGTDAKIFYCVPPKCKEILQNAARRHLSQDKLVKLYSRMKIPGVLDRLYEGESEEAIEAIKRIDGTFDKYADDEHKISHFYKNEYELLNDIRNGCVYAAHTGDRKTISGIFSFRSVNEVGDLTAFPQFANTLESTGLQPKYVMVYAGIDMTITNEAFNSIMTYFVVEQAIKGWMPAMFNILKPFYAKPDNYIRFPWVLNGTNGEIEFFNAKQLRYNMFNKVYDSFREVGYEPDLDNDKDIQDVNAFIDILMHYRMLEDVKKDSIGSYLLDKYPKMSPWFMPDSYPDYGAGIKAPEKEKT